MGGLVLIVMVISAIIRLATRSQGGGAMRDLAEKIEKLKAEEAKQVSGLDVLTVATDAFMNKGKSFDEVKATLKTKGLSDYATDSIAQRACDIYLKWYHAKSPYDQVAHDERMKKINDPLPDQHKDVLLPGISLTVNAPKNNMITLQYLLGNALTAGNGREVVAGLASIAAIQTPVKLNDYASICEANFHKTGGNEENPFIRTVLLKGERSAIFPYLKTDKTFSFETKTIAEYDGKRNYNILAEVEGTLAGGQSIGFFATDYPVNKLVYKSSSKLNVCISAFAASVSLWSGKNDKLVDANYVGYFPNNQYDGLNYYNFVGRILKVRGMPISPANPGCILTLLLFKNTVTKTELIVDVFVNNDNIKTDEIKKDMTVEGLLWFQGEIA